MIEDALMNKQTKNNLDKLSEKLSISTDQIKKLRFEYVALQQDKAILTEQLKHLRLENNDIKIKFTRLLD